jgi:uncharacterized membrane-anchored protein YhcB (DUF1043 family)
MNDILAELKKMKDDVDISKNEVSKAEGRKEELFNRLQKEYGMKSLEVAEKQIEELVKTSSDLEKEIRSEHSILKNDYKWEE